MPERKPVPRTRAANSHAKRVTMNLIRHAGCCPAELRAALDTLARHDWDLDALAQINEDHVQIIWGHVDEALATRAAAEFVADTRSIRDHRRSDHVCDLCGHQHIRWEFTIRNTQGGRDVNCGSSCIIEYGINVDGEGSGEAAKRALAAAINGMKKKAARDAWQADHPNHEMQMEGLAAFERRCCKSEFAYPPGLWRHLKPNWVKRVRKIRGRIKTVLKYYRRERFLTVKKTDDTYGAGGLLDQSIAMITEYTEAHTAWEAKKNPSPNPKSTNPSGAPKATDETDLPF